MSLPPFEQVVEEHGPRVLRVCRAILGYHEAEDAWSETFLAALQAAVSDFLNAAGATPIPEGNSITRAAAPWP